MDHETMMKCGNYFALCENCNNVTVLKFTKCHKCHEYIDKKNYKQSSSINKYVTLVISLMAFGIDILEDCHSMISISIKEDKSYAPELYQIRKENNKYKYIHFEKDTHIKLREYEIDPLSFVPKLSDDKQYEVSLVYGPNVIYVHQ